MIGRLLKKNLEELKASSLSDCPKDYAYEDITPKPKPETEMLASDNISNKYKRDKTVAIMKIYNVKQITEADYGCEDTSRKEPTALLILEETESHREERVEMTERLIAKQGITEGKKVCFTESGELIVNRVTDQETGTGMQTGGMTDAQKDI